MFFVLRHVASAGTNLTKGSNLFHKMSLKKHLNYYVYDNWPRYIRMTNKYGDYHNVPHRKSCAAEIFCWCVNVTSYTWDLLFP